MRLSLITVTIPCWLLWDVWDGNSRIGSVLVSSSSFFFILNDVIRLVLHLARGYSHPVFPSFGAPIARVNLGPNYEPFTSNSEIYFSVLCVNTHNWSC